MTHTFQKPDLVVPNVAQLDGQTNLSNTPTTIISAVVDQSIKLYYFSAYATMNTPVIIGNGAQPFIYSAVQGGYPLVLDLSRIPVELSNNTALTIAGFAYDIQLNWSLLYVQD